MPKILTPFGYHTYGEPTMLKIFGTEISGRAILESQVHTVIETVGGIGWLTLVLAGHPVWGAITWFVTLEVEHILALAAGKDA